MHLHETSRDPTGWFLPHKFNHLGNIRVDGVVEVIPGQHQNMINESALDACK
jgi:hypothetical protein